jgi:hypothetical protein
MEEQKKTKVEKKDILEEVKELDRKVRAKIVYDKLVDIKSWAREIAELKLKTQFLLEELGVEAEDIKRLIDYATNSPEAQINKDDMADLKDEVKEMIAESKEKVHKKMADSPMAYVMTAGSGNMTNTAYPATYTVTSGSTGTGSTATWTSSTDSSDNIEFKMK